MHKKLILECFEKAKSQAGTEVVSSLSKHISEILLEDYSFQVNERTLRNYFKEAEKNDGEDFNISKSIANELAKYLGNKSLRDYSESNRTIKKNKTLKTYIIGVLIVMVTYFGFKLYQDNCMIWKGDHYEKISCEEENDGSIDSKLLKNFKKIRPNCEPIYFNKKGEIKIWYGKNRIGELEYFTLLGMHPETGKTLKPITAYMIKKHICPTWGK